MVEKQVVGWLENERGTSWLMLEILEQVIGVCNGWTSLCRGGYDRPLEYVLLDDGGLLFLSEVAIVGRMLWWSWIYMAGAGP